MNLKKFIKEFRRRNVFQSAITYLIVAWLVAQVFDVILPTFDAPPYIMQTLIFILIIGFPISLIFTWIYEISPKGIKKIINAEKLISITTQSNKQLEYDNKKLAVLPFKNISSNNDSDYFSDGLTEEIIIRLSKIKELDIASRHTSMHYRDSELDIVSLGREFKARYILHGTVRKLNDNLRISAELIDVAKDSELWAEIYSGNMADVFGIQEKVQN